VVRRRAVVLAVRAWVVFREPARGLEVGFFALRLAGLARRAAGFFAVAMERAQWMARAV
jgi:hypothetical protein